MLRWSLLQGHGHGVYPLIYLPGGLEPDSDEECDEVAEAAEAAEAEATEASGGGGNNGISNKEDATQDMLIAQTDAVITGSADGTAKIWSLYSGECLFVSGF